MARWREENTEEREASFKDSAFENTGIEWPLLERGDRVVLSGPGTYRVSGLLDAITADGSIFWIHEDGGQGRKLISRGDGFTVEKIAP